MVSRAVPKLLILLLLNAAPMLGQSAEQLSEVKRIYIDSLGSKNGAEGLRKDLASELRKSGVIELAPTASKADAVLTGNSEIWVKGYYSLNPRSGRSPADGTGVYGGFLSVELKGKDDDTLWSSLVTPRTGSTDVLHDLSKEVVRQLLKAILQQRK